MLSSHLSLFGVPLNLSKSSRVSRRQGAGGWKATSGQARRSVRHMIRARFSGMFCASCFSSRSRLSLGYGSYDLQFWVFICLFSLSHSLSSSSFEVSFTPQFGYVHVAAQRSVSFLVLLAFSLYLFVYLCILVSLSPGVLPSMLPTI